MLSDRSRPIVQATLPVVADNIPEIARRFYRHMSEGNPELLDGIFNRGNQAEGTQQVALAGSLAAFASALVQTPEQLPDHAQPHCAQARVAWDPAGAVPARPRQPLLGHRRRTR
jgi:hemoglobin-like flavoprotein